MKDLTLFLALATFPSINTVFYTLWGLLAGESKPKVAVVGHSIFREAQ